MGRVGDTMYNNIVGDHDITPACLVDFGIEDEQHRLLFLEACYKAKEQDKLSGDLLQDLITGNGAAITKFVTRYTGRTDVVFRTVYDELGW